MTNESVSKSFGDFPHNVRVESIGFFEIADSSLLRGSSSTYSEHYLVVLSAPEVIAAVSVGVLFNRLCLFRASKRFASI